MAVSKVTERSGNGHGCSCFETLPLLSTNGFFAMTLRITI